MIQVGMSQGRFIAIWILVVAGLALAQADWVSYQNPRFGYRLSVPPGLQVSNRAADGSGVTWQTGTVRVQVSGSNNPYKVKPHEYFERMKRAAADRIVTESQGVDEKSRYWCEMLYTKDGRRVHQKVFVSSGAINTVEFSYAYKYREEKERLGQRVMAGFQAGDLSRGH
jgi:hypothetical protein